MYTLKIVAKVRMAGLAGGVAIAVFCCLGATSAPATPAPVTPAPATPALVAPQLSVTIDDGRTTAATSDVLRYEIVVHNLGSDDIKDLVLTQTVPAGLTFGSADSTGKQQGALVIWPVNLKTAASGTFHTTMTVGTTPTSLLQMASVACVSTSATGAPIVCASHFDQLPAGATAAVQASGGTSAARQVWWFAGGGVVLIIVIATAAVLRHRRRSTLADQPADMADIG